MSGLRVEQARSAGTAGPEPAFAREERVLDPAPRLAVLTSHPIQYQAPLWRALATRLDLTVFFCSTMGLEGQVDPEFGVPVSWDTPLLEGYRSEFLTNWSPVRDHARFLALVNPGVMRHLAAGRFDALLLRGYSNATCWLAWAAARLFGVATFMHVETPFGFSRRRWLQPAKALLLGPVLRGMNGCLAIGQENERFYRSYGVRPDRITLTPYAVDNRFFSTQADLLGSRRSELRAALNLGPEEVVVLFVGKLIDRKHPELLLRAAAELPQVTVLFVGDGEQRRQLEGLAQTLGMRTRARFEGFVNQSGLPRYYTVADVFSLPAEGEYWGLVVNEAMNFGLPILVADGVAAAKDLVREGGNGFVVPSRDVGALRSRLAALSGDETLRKAMGAASRQLIQEWGIDQAADGIASAVGRAVALRRGSQAHG